MKLTHPTLTNIPNAFRAAAASSKRNIAIEFGALSLSYAEVDAATDALAAELALRGITAGGYVGIAAANGVDAVLGMLATLKAGAAYVPLPAYYPEERLRHIVREAGISLVIGEDDFALAGTVTMLPAAAKARRGATTPHQPVDSADAAYVMYTSGSTGTPKGVVVPHRAILRLVIGQNFMTLNNQVRFLQNSPIAFDAATLEIWGALLNGGTLVIPEGDTQSLRGLGQAIRELNITSLWLTAGLFHAMADERPTDFAPLKELLTGGDVVSPTKVAKVMAACPGLRVINGYGPTENTTFTCCHTITAAEAASGTPLPIGTPVSGTKVFIVDEALNRVEDGQTGELCAAGDGLALGYLNRADLTAEKFVNAPWNRKVKLYRTGDMARRDADGVIRYLGRIDTQVKVRGFRIELGEIEAAMEGFAGVRQATVVARPGADGADKTLVGYYVADAAVDDGALVAHLTAELPDYEVPARLIALEALPLNANGKVDRRALEARDLPVRKTAKSKSKADSRGIEDMIAIEMASALGQPDVDRDANFFDLGASSLHVARVHERVQTALDRTFPIGDFFLHSTIAALASHLAGNDTDVRPVITSPAPGEQGEGLIAIVGLAGRFPGARSADEFWKGLVEGREMISHFTPEELDVDLSPTDPNGQFVYARGVMPDAELFDAKHFNIPPREAERMDPQHRILLEVAQDALESAGHDPERFAGKIGVFAGSSQNSYLLNNLLSAPGASRTYAATYPLDDFSTLFGNDKDFVATRIAYKLNLRGPAVSVLCACSTSLVAVAQACESLRRGTSDMALAGGVSVTFPSKRNYKYLPDGMASADGHCRTFDADATGTVFGDGAGLVVLRRLEDALADGDEIIAVIRGYSINNDGSEKAGYAAPSIKAQAQVIREAHRAAGVTARDIGYVEAHGTATPLGDPIEFAALNMAFGEATGDRSFCRLGSAKTNVGHLDIAAGITGLIKAALTLKHGKIPPLLHYKKPNKAIDFANSAFVPNAELTDWAPGGVKRLAGVSAFGVGGTNIHMVLEEAPAAEPAGAVIESNAPMVFPVSASSADAVKAAVSDLALWAAAHPNAIPAEVAETLRNGRKQYGERAVIVAGGMADLATQAAAHSGKPVTAGRRDRVAFLFPGQGAQHVGMARDLYAVEPVFREALSLCATLLEPALGLNLLDIIHAPESQAEEMTAKLKNTAIAQPAIFSIGYALAKQWAYWGIEPDVMVGHSIGELAAATIAGVIDLKDALGLIALRGKLMAGLPGGVMISVRASETEVLPFLGAGLDLAAVNGAKAVVLAGSEDAAAKIIPGLEAAGFVTSRLHTSHAFHSYMMDAAVAPFRDAVAKLTLRAPRIPIVSTVTGDWLTEAEATDPDYWANHMRRPVRFYDAVQVLWAEGRHMFLETGPGRTMSVLAGQNPDRKAAQPALASLPHAQAEQADSHRSMLEAFGLLWANGYPVDWRRLDAGRAPARRATGLPTYAYQRKRFWVEPVTTLPASAAPVALTAITTDETTNTPVADVPAAKVDAGAALREMLSELSGVDPADMDGSATFLELGFDSLLLTQATRELSDRFGVTVTLRQLIDGLPTIDALAAHVEANGNLAGTAPADRTPVAEMTRIEGKPSEDEAKASPSSAPMTKISREVEELAPAQRASIDALTARYTAKTQKSKELTVHYRPFHADPRTASGFNRLWKEIVYQIVTVKSKGSRLLDVDGNEYIDILNGFGPGFLGHSPDAVVAALHDQVNNGFEVGPQSLLAMEASELFCQVTGNDRASFVCTGSEAVYAAMRLARTVTARDKIVMFARDYHGNFDEVLVRAVDGKDGPRTLPLAPGVPRDSVTNIIVLPYGTPQALDYIRKNASQLAAVIVEPVQSRRPEFRPAEFIREVRRITENNGTLFIFDEVVTGFRFGPRGAQAYYNIDADLVTYGKVVGGGMPLGVVSGKARFMDTFDGGQWGYGDDSFPQAPVTFFAGTFVRHPLVMAALKSMLTFFKSQPDFFWKTVNAKGDKLAGTLDRWFAENDMPFQYPNCGSLMYLRIGEDQKFGPLLGSHVRDRGVFFLEGFPSYMTAAHDDEDIDHVIEAFKDSALEMRAAGLLTGREAVAYDGPQVSAVPPRLSLPGGEQRIAEAMAAPLGVLSVPTTEAQREIWAAMIVTPEVTPGYNESVTLKMHGKVDRQLLLDSVADCLQRHDSLRATFTEDGSEMLVHPSMDIPVDFVDLSAASETVRNERLSAIIQDEVTRPFNTIQGPFVRAQLVALGEAEHHLIITAHHIVCDGWSVDVVMRDIGKVYSARLEGRRPDLPPPQSIIDYARAEAEWTRTEGAAAARDYWLERFAGEVPVLDLPTDRPRPMLKTARGARIDRVIPAELADRLRKLGRANGSTFVNLLLAAYKVYVARVSQVSDIVIGLPASGQAARGMPGVVGHCVNLLPIRTQIDWDKGFDTYLGTVRKAMLDAFDFQNFTYGELIRQLRLPRDPSRVMLVPVIFNIDNGIDLSTMSFGPVETEFVTNPRNFEHFELYLNVTDAPGDVRTEWSFNVDLFDHETIERHIDSFILLLERLIAEPAKPLGDLPMLAGAAAAELRDFANPAPVPVPEVAVHKLFEQRVAISPDATALVLHEGYGTAAGNVSFGALDARANRIANALIARGVSRGDLVGVALERGQDMLAAIIAICKTGAGYLPLDPAFPADRIAYMLDDSKARFVIATDDTRALAGNVPVLDPVKDLSSDTRAPSIDVSPDDRAYVLYTSGSTGKPKGVEIGHRAFVNFLTSMLREPGLSETDKLLAVTTLSFDIAGLELWGPLLAGGTVVLARRDDAVDPEALVRLLSGQGITVMQATPSTWRMLLDAGWSGSARIKALCGGEALPLDLAQRLSMRVASLWNMYGPTETTVWSTVARIDRTATSVPVGLPIANTEIVVLDARMQPVPPGVAGELYIGGMGLAKGYLGRPDLTAERFVDHPQQPGEHLYRTGDLARWMRQGDGYVLECLGRADNQIKLRGFRIEPEEIEARLQALPGVRQAAVVLREDQPGDQRLVACLVSDGGNQPDGPMLAAGLAADLPRYMIPTRFVWFDALPLTPNGKTDRGTLSKRPLQDVQDSGHRGALPVTATERELLEIWVRLLNVPEIGVEDDFFSLGGHSLMAVKLFGRIRRKFGVDLPISTLFAHPTIRSLARKVTVTQDAVPEAHYAGTPEDSPWDTTVIIHPGPAQSTVPALFIVGGVGGNVNNLVDLGKELGRYRKVVGLQTRGVLGHRMHETVEAMAADHLVNIRNHQPTGPYHIAGYSAGALTAFEMARQLEAAGEDVAYVGILDMSAPGFEVGLVQPLRHKLAQEARALAENGAGAFARRLLPRMREMLMTKSVVRVGAKFMPEKFRVIEMSRHFWGVADAYRPGKAMSPLTLYLTEDESLMSQRMRAADPEFGWRKLVGGTLTVRHIKSGHLNLLEGAAVQELAQLIETDMRAAG
ncbi:MAG: amino acid adenylation domain-containing protein [Paracoccaceae bacterium]